MLLRYLPQLARQSSNQGNHHLRRTIFNATAKRRVTKTTRLLAPVDQVASVVADVSSYSEFLPFCTQSVVYVPTSHLESPPTTFQADLTFEWGTFRENIRHLVEVNEGPPYTVTSVAESSRIAKQVSYEWEFRPTESNGTEVGVSMTVEFNSILHAAVFDLQIEQVVQDVLSSFRDRINTRQR
jgi:ribosome-associated toxin RatA of RatAB toxin-antitoxin module